MRTHGLAAFSPWILTSLLAAQGVPIGLEEHFALASDRQKVVDNLIPGSEDFYFYQALHWQNAGELAKVPALLELWRQRHGTTGRYLEIETRQRLLAHEANPAATFAWLRDRLGLRFDAQRKSGEARVDLPSRVEPARLTDEVFLQRVLAEGNHALVRLGEAQLAGVAASTLDDDRLRAVLEHPATAWPDLPNLVPLVARSLALPRSGGFGSLRAHRTLTRDQLEELARLRPAVLAEDRFVARMLETLAPSADTNWLVDAAAREAYLDRLQAFASRLPAAQNSLKAHVLQNRLVHDRALGKLDRERLLAYLRLPRRSAWANPEYLQRVTDQSRFVLPERSFATGLPNLRDDTELVRECLQHFLAEAENDEAFRETVEETWLRRLFAETKILAGKGDMERWYSLLGDASAYEALKARVEILFPATQRRAFGASDPVAIEVDVKNVEKLLVRVFAIDSFAYARDTGKEVDAGIELDGVLASEERSETYQENPLRRVRRRFEFPTLQRPGTYVVEFLGNGLASRAVIEKGHLRFVARLGSAGHVLTVLDETGARVPRAAVWCAGRLFEADERGEVAIPFAAKDGSVKIVLRRGMQGALHTFRHRAEEYQLGGHLLVGRESLVAGGRARIVVRPSLVVGETPIDLGLLEDVVLTIRATDLDGVESSVVVRDRKLSNDQDLVHEISVPERLAKVRVALEGKVKHLGLGKPVELAAEIGTVTMNAIEATPATRAAVLGRAAAGHFLEVRGKSGEPRAGVPLALGFFRRGYGTTRVDLEAITDARGRVELGELDGITGLACPTLGAEWTLDTPCETESSTLAGLAGRTLRLPYHGAASRPERTAFAFFEVADGRHVGGRSRVPVRDAFEHLAVRDAFLELQNLPAGDYELRLKESGRSIAVHVTAGAAEAGWAIGRDRVLSLPAREPLQVGAASLVGDQVEIRIANANPNTRVHLVATRYLEPFDLLGGQRRPRGPGFERREFDAPESLFVAGRQIGDEARYILERRYSKPLPGNLLARPGLLLNPWELRADATEEGRSLGTGGGGSGRRGGRAAPSGAAPAPRPETLSLGHHGLFANVDFVPGAAPLLCNLRPDAQGLVRVPRAELGHGQDLHVVAVDDLGAVQRRLALPELAFTPRGRELASSLDPARHFTEQRRIEFVQAGGSTTVTNARAAKLESYGSVAQVFGLLRTLSGNEELDRFEFLTRWPKLTPAEKRALYSEHACHELHYFLARRDRPFFDEVVRPYLANKLERTFLDRWLLDEDLTRYREPWTFERLNVFERILLTRRLAADRDAGVRALREALDVLPADTEREQRVFTTALLGRALDAEPDGVAKLAELEKAKAPGAPARGQDKAERLEAKPEAKNRDEGEQRPAEEAQDEVSADSKKDLAAPKKGRGAEAGEGRPGADDFAAGLLADRERRKSVVPLYRAPDRTRVLAESQYWHVAVATPDLVGVNAFWRDFAVAPEGLPFCSSNLALATGSLTEMLLALAVTDLPFEAAPPKVTTAGDQVTIASATPLLLVRQEVLPATGEVKDVPVLLSQNLFRLDDRYRFEGAQRLEKFATGEFLVDVAYGAQVVVTNPTSTPRKLDLLLQVPAGAVPVQGSFATRGLVVQLEAFATRAIEFAFYFPNPGEFALYPAHVGKEGALVAAAGARTLRVVGKPSTVDTTSWAHVAHHGTPEAVLAYVDANNLARLDLGEIAWRLRDRTFFTALVARLRARLHYSDLVWSHGVLHGDELATREYLEHRTDFVALCGRRLVSRLLVVDPFERGTHRHLEFDPLIHARAHRVGNQRVILNPEFASQYDEFCTQLAYLPRLTDTELARVTYYLLLQDRNEEALATFARIDPVKLGSKLQYDYLRCYLDFFGDEHRLARSVAESYREHPVTRWRARFQDVLHQLDEAEGKAVAASDPSDRAQQLNQLAANLPALEASAEGHRVSLRWQNLGEVQVLYHRLDVEAAFSSTPFVANADRAFAYVQPARTDVLALPAGQKELAFDLPAEFQRANVLVEVRGAGLARRVSCLASSLAVQIVEGSGQLRVSARDGGKPLPKVYVKVYARLADGRTRFHKDGYTDLRGRFDYASISEPGNESAQRYAILVLGETEGAVVREVTPPGR